MEMDNSALMQVINTQNMLLQSMQGTQQLQKAQPDAEKTAMTSALAQAQSMANTPTPAMRPYNGYATYEPLMASSPAVYGSGKKNYDAKDGFVAQTVGNFFEYDASRNSKESTSDMFAEQTKSIQDKVIGGGSALAQGAAFAGSFFVPGLLPSLAVGAAGGALVGGTIGAITDGADSSSAIQEILRKKGHKALNAMESTNEFGGAGINLNDRQDLAKHIRHLAPEKLLEDQEMQKILNGALDNKLLKSATDIESFKKKFDNIVDQVKQITLTMNQSIEEATAFMGEMERRGVGVENMSTVSAKMKVTGSFLGIDADKAAQKFLGATDQIVQGTAIDPNKVIGDLTASAYSMTKLEEKYKKEGNDSMYHLIKNSGGSDQVAIGFDNLTRQFIEGDKGKELLVGLYGQAVEKTEDGFKIDNKKMKEISDGLASGSMDVNELARKTSSQLSQLSPEDQFTIRTTISENLLTDKTGQQISQAMNSMVDAAMAGGKFENRETAIKTLLPNLSAEQAKLFDAQSQSLSQGDVYNALNAKSIREEMDAQAQSNTTGMVKSAKYWWRRNVSSHLGDFGQYVGDEIADFSTSFQKWQTGIGDRSIIGGTLLNEFGEEDLGKGTKERVDKINKVLERDAQRLQSKDILERDYDENLRLQQMEKGKINLNDFKKDERARISKDSFSGIIDSIDDDTITGSSLRKLKDQINDGQLKGIDKQRADYALNKATGEYDGVTGTLKQAYDRTSIAFTPETPWFGSGKDLEKGNFKVNGNTNYNEALKGIEASTKELDKEGEKLSKEFKKVFSGSKMNDVDKKDYAKLESLIKSGEIDKVKEMTKSDDIIKLAEKYESFTKKKDEQKDATKSMKDLGRQSEGYARLAGDLKSFVGISGAMDEDELNALFKSYEKYGDTYKEQLKDGKISVNDSIDQSEAMYKQGKEIFENMSPEKLTKIAKAMEAKTQGQIKYQDLLDDNGQTVDAQKVFNSLSNDIIRQGHKDKDDDDSIVNGKENKDGGKDSKKAADKHEKAMDNFVNAMVGEAKKLDEATKSIKNGSYRTKNTFTG
jgi:hypothetical protein